MVESAYMNIPIISSDCDNGPKEILAHGKNGILFKSNDKVSLLNALLNLKIWITKLSMKNCLTAKRV